MAAEGEANAISTEELHKLMDKALCASATGRNALAAAFFRRAAEAATRVQGDTLMAAHLRLCQAAEMRAQAALNGVPAEEIATLRSTAWEIAKGVLPLLLRRIEANTLLPGRCTKEEVEYFRQYNDEDLKANDAPALSARERAVLGFAVGSATAFEAARSVLINLYKYQLPSNEERRSAEAFVLHIVDLILPASRSLSVAPGEEIRFYHLVHNLSDLPALQSDAFFATLRAKWTAPELVAMRVERGFDAAWVKGHIEGNVGQIAANRAADIEEHGLKICAFPSCDKREATVKQFRLCSACRSASYCSEEHGALRWREHKPTCRATVAAKQAASDGGAAA